MPLLHEQPPLQEHILTHGSSSCNLSWCSSPLGAPPLSSVPLSGLLLSQCSTLSVPLSGLLLSRCSSSLGAPLRGQRITVKLRDNHATEDKTCLPSSLGLCWFHGWGDEGNPGQRSVTTRSPQTHDSPSEKVGPFLSHTPCRCCWITSYRYPS